MHPGPQCQQDSAANACCLLQVLEGYASWLENRVVSRFDAATVEGNYAQQAQVVAIMTELDKEKSIAKVRPAVLCPGSVRTLAVACPTSAVQSPVSSYTALIMPCAEIQSQALARHG
jgi:hypothetical protein